MKKRIICLMLVILLSLLTTGCCLSHEWAEATCTAPKTCTKCGKTEGDMLPHTWEEATCKSAKKCTICTTIEGEPLPHTMSEATCVKDSKCSVCGTSGTKALGHSPGTKWEIISDPTPTKEGIKGRKCTRCSEIVEETPFRSEPENITVLEPTGFTMSQLEYHQHLLRYLSMDYKIEDNGFDYELNKNGYDDISIYWKEGDKEYQDNVAFLGDVFSIERVLKELVISIDPNVSEDDMDRVMDMWIKSRDFRKGDMTAVPLHTGMLIIYKGTYGHQAMFCTLQYYLESYR